MRDLPSAPPAPRLFIGCHWRGGNGPADAALSAAIEFATRVRFGGPRPFVLGAQHPATHAFVVCGALSSDAAQDAPGAPGSIIGWRVDADIPLATVAPITDFTKHTFPHTALWEILPTTEISPAAGVAQAWRDSRAIYDIPQAAIQPLAGLASRAAQTLGLPEPPSTLLPKARICTELACRALAACGGQAEQAARRVARGDMLPEELALELQGVEHSGWCRRIPLI